MLRLPGSFMHSTALQHASRCPAAGLHDSSHHHHAPPRRPAPNPPRRLASPACRPRSAPRSRPPQTPAAPPPRRRSVQGVPAPQRKPGPRRTRGARAWPSPRRVPAPSAAPGRLRRPAAADGGGEGGGKRDWVPLGAAAAAAAASRSPRQFRMHASCRSAGPLTATRNPNGSLSRPKGLADCDMMAAEKKRWAGPAAAQEPSSGDALLSFFAREARIVNAGA